MQIVVATDGSDSANKAVDFAARLANDLGGSLKIVNIVVEHDPPPKQLAEFARQEHVAPEVFLGELSEHILQLANQRARNVGVSAAKLESQKGDATKWIIEIARRDNADVIVVGKRGLGHLSGLLLGSVSQNIVTVASIPVVVAP